MSKLTTASVLAFQRNLDISDGLFFQANSKDQNQADTPINIREKSVRGTISNRLKKAIAADPVKLDAEVQKPNLQTVDVAMLDNDKDTLVARWTLKVLPFDGEPNVCNDQTYREKMTAAIQSYVSEQGFSELARRYAVNIVNGRWLWRNRLGAEQISVRATCSIDSESAEIEDATSLGLNGFEASHPAIDIIKKWIETGLKGDHYTLITIEARARVGQGQEVFPSQELILDTGDKKSKVLFQINQQAGLHSQKIGNAIRTIDTWYSDEYSFPIAVEPYGSVTTMGTAFRQPKNKNDFYNLFDNWVLNDKAPSLEQQHFVIATLIRGGVFGASGKD